MKYIRLVLIPILLLSLTATSVSGDAPHVEMTPDNKVEAKEIDQRAKILADYFRKYDSPFQYHAQDFIDAADTYGVDWRLVPAISGVESTFGKNSYGYNAWGWGIYGDNRLNFGSWRDGIFTVTAGIKEKYINKGLTNPYSMNRVYAASPTWGSRVSYFMNDLDNFAKNSNGEADKTIEPSTPSFEAASSAELAYNY